MNGTDWIIHPPAYRYAAGELADLQADLSEMTRNTRLHQIQSVRDVLINPDTGATFNGWRYTDTALNRMCNTVCKGLNYIIPDLAGVDRTPDQSRQQFSPTIAIELFNRVVRFRFDHRLMGNQLVVSEKDRQIDGIVGSRYRHLPNDEFLAQVLTSYQKEVATFFEAMLYGRNLVVRFQLLGHKYDLNGTPFTAGIHTGTSEIGASSMKATCLLIGPDSSCAMVPYVGNRVIHAGSQFGRRLTNVLHSAVNKAPKPQDIESKATKAAAKLLGFTGEESNDVIVRKRITSVLSRQGLVRGFFQDVIKATVVGDVDDSTFADLSPNQRKLVVSGRSTYDLFMALIRESRRQLLSLENMEKAERMAYAILVGQLSV